MIDHKRSSSKWGVLLLIVGALLLLGQLGIHIGWILGMIIPVILITKGWKWVSRSQRSFKRFCGAGFLVIGIFWLIGMLPILIGLILSVSLIYFGWRMIKNQRSGPQVASEPYYGTEAGYSPFNTCKPMDDLDEWEKRMNNYKGL